jgi:hypothetical protein
VCTRVLTFPCILTSMPDLLSHQFAYLVLLAIPIACVSWTITHEEVFREPRDWCKQRSQNCRRLPIRKFFYLFTCEYCFSHYVTIIFLIITQFQLLYTGWRGYLIAWFALVWIANIYMCAFNRLRLEIKHENVEIAMDETGKDAGARTRTR